MIATVALYAVGKVGEGLAPVLLARDWPACLALLVLNANDLHLVLTVRSCSGAGQLLAWFCVFFDIARVTAATVGPGVARRAE